MARVLQNRLTHLLSSRRSSTPRSSQVSQLHSSRISQRFWNLLNLEYSQRNNGWKCDAATKADCSTSNPRLVPLKTSRAGSKPSVAELLSKWCCQFNDKFHHDQAPQLPYYRQRAPRLPRRPCSQAPFCPTAPCPPEPCPSKPCDPCQQPEPCPPKPSDPCQNLKSHSRNLCQTSKNCATESPRDPCKKPKVPNPYKPSACPPRPYPVKPCEQCPRTPSCPKPKPCPPPPKPKPACPDPCEPCPSKSTPMGCPISTPMDCPMPIRCIHDEQQQLFKFKSSSGIIPMIINVNRSLLGTGRSRIRRLHGTTMRNMICNNNDNNSSVKKRPRPIVKKGKKSKSRSHKATVREDGMSLGKTKPRSKRRNIKSKTNNTSSEPNKT